MDYFRTDCIKSYFEIVALVNKGNKTINEQTEAVFFIDQRKLFLGIDQKQKVYLCFEDGHWYPGGHSGHSELEKFVCILLNGNQLMSSELNAYIKRQLFRLPS